MTFPHPMFPIVAPESVLPDIRQALKPFIRLGRLACVTTYHLQELQAALNLIFITNGKVSTGASTLPVFVQECACLPKHVLSRSGILGQPCQYPTGPACKGQHHTAHLLKTCASGHTCTGEAAIRTRPLKEQNPLHLVHCRCS